MSIKAQMQMSQTPITDQISVLQKTTSRTLYLPPVLEIVLIQV